MSTLQATYRDYIKGMSEDERRMTCQQFVYVAQTILKERGVLARKPFPYYTQYVEDGRSYRYRLDFNRRFFERFTTDEFMAFRPDLFRFQGS